MDWVTDLSFTIRLDMGLGTALLHTVMDSRATHSRLLAPILYGVRSLRAKTSLPNAVLLTVEEWA